ncbi:MAG: hypothetical protein NT138_24165 [Planctomycetales bacterium]|nr:hypothetical protein [Planctomycetales bacterium]
MRDLVQLSNEELNELTTAQRLRIFVAIGVSVASGIVSLQGMAAVFTDANVVPLPGMQHLAGQIAWVFALIAMLLLVTFLVRGVIKRRLQWAIALSLLIHFLLCLSMTTVDFRGPLPTPAQAADLSQIPHEEFTLPDYATSDVPDPAAAWLQQNETETPDRELEPERSEVMIAEVEKAESEAVASPQVAEEAETPERREKVELAPESAEQMERQTTTGEMEEPRVVVAPDVAAAASAEEVKLEDQVEQNKAAAEIPVTERQLDNSDSPEMQVEAARIQANRSEAEVTPEMVDAAASEREVAEAEAVESKLEEIEVASKEAAQSNPKERSTDISRQASANPALVAESNMRADVASPSVEPTVRAQVPSRSARAEEFSGGAPADGGVAVMARSTTVSAAQAASTGVAAESVEVSSTGEVSSPTFSESANSRSGQRTTTAKVPAGTMAAGELKLSTGPTGSGVADNSPSGVKVAKSQSVGAARPGLGTEAGLSIAPGPRSRTGAEAVGTAASESGVSGVGVGTKPTAEGMIAGPARTSTGRQSGGLPTGKATGEAGALIQSRTVSNGVGPSSTAASGLMKAATGGIDGARGTEPNARLSVTDGFAGGRGPGLARSKSMGALPGLAEGAVAAERGGALVIAGPQAASAGLAAVAGPRTRALPRRSAGLPGASGPAPASSGVGTAGDPSLSSRITTPSGRKGVGVDRPSLASAEAIAGLAKKSVQGRGSSPEASIPESLSMRTTDARREAAKTLGGSEDSEEAVERGLQWLIRNQYPDGHWSIDDFPGETSESLGEGSFVSNSAATGLSLLAFLGAGYTHQSGKHQEAVDRGMKWLLEHQKSDGDLFADETEFVWFYSHGIASIALCEAYGLTKDPALRAPAQKALDFIVESQHKEFGGWRYRPQFESDTSVSGWQLMALKSGEMAGLNVPKDSYTGVSRWLDSVESKSAVGQFSYHPREKVSPAMTAEGLLMRQYLGAKREDAQLIAGANYLRTRLPDFGQRDAYYWYYATQVMFHMQGDHWNEWNNGLRDLLVMTQSKEGSVSGSWDPSRPSADKWANGGGRHYLTCLNLLMLEVYYRHLPLYLELEK